MATDSPSSPASDPVPYKHHRSSSIFGSTGITAKSGTNSLGFLVCSILSLLLIVTGAVLLVAGAPTWVGITVITFGILCVIAGMVVLVRERAATANRRRVSRATANQMRTDQARAN